MPRKNLKKRSPKSFQGPIKKVTPKHQTHKQNWSRTKNVHTKATTNTELGKKIRSMLYEMTKDKKYRENNFQKNFSQGKTYSKTEIRSSLSLAKKLALENTKKQHKKVTQIQKKKGLKQTSFSEFKKANPHLVNPTFGFDTADIESFYDS